MATVALLALTRATLAAAGAVSFTGQLTRLLDSITGPITVIGALGIVVAGIAMIFGAPGTKHVMIGCVVGILIAQSAHGIASLITG
jgi:type IV secretory pathway VirB2 component (pilin)